MYMGAAQILPSAGSAVQRAPLPWCSGLLLSPGGVSPFGRVTGQVLGPGGGDEVSVGVDTAEGLGLVKFLLLVQAMAANTTKPDTQSHRDMPDEQSQSMC